MIAIIIGILFLVQTEYTAIWVLFIIWGVLSVLKGIYTISQKIN